MQKSPSAAPGIYFLFQYLYATGGVDSTGAKHEVLQAPECVMQGAPPPRIHLR